MAEKLLIGLDLGTTNIKGVLFSEYGKIIRKASSPVNYEYGHKGIVEYDASAFRDKVLAVIRDLTDERVCALSMVSASGNTILLDRKMNPLRPAISWLDKRCIHEYTEPMAGYYEKTGWPYGGTFPYAHLSWLKDNEVLNFEKAKKICMTTDYVNYILTGELKTNPSTATTFYLQDQIKEMWNPDILSKLGIAAGQLPEIIPTGSRIGEITEAASKETGLKKGIPVIAGSFDHPGAARGLGILEEGSLLLSCGTSWVGFYPSESREKLMKLKMLTDPFMRGHGCWAGMFSIPRIGNNIDLIIKRWVSYNDDRYGTFNELAAVAEPFKIKINPIEDIDRNFGGNRKEDICRGIMEGTALMMKEKMDYFAANGLEVDKIVMAGGPTNSPLWMDILCDILEKKIKMGGSHAGALGAAVMAGIGAGIFKDEYDARNRGVCNGTI